MIISQTPFRISFFGGGTDYRRYFEEFGGSVISTTFDKYCHIIIRKLPPFFKKKSKLMYSKVEEFDDYFEIDHPSVRECLKYLDINNVHIIYDGDLPARSGLGSSSSFTVGLLNSLYAYKGVYIDKTSLAEKAIFIEQEMIKENVGIQDQIAAAYGGFNRIDFNSSGFSVSPILISNERKQLLNDHLMLFFSGISRTADAIAADKINNIKNKLSSLHEMKLLVDDAHKILVGNGDITEFGKLLDYSWSLKRSLSSMVSTSFIDDIYSRALEAGAVGGKLLGAGGGGFIVFFVPPENQEAVREALSDLLFVPFKLDDSGSKIIHYRPEA